MLGSRFRREMNLNLALFSATANPGMLLYNLGHVQKIRLLLLPYLVQLDQ